MVRSNYFNAHLLVGLNRTAPRSLGIPKILTLLADRQHQLQKIALVLSETVLVLVLVLEILGEFRY